MEGGAGAGRLNPPPMSMIGRLRRREPTIREESHTTSENNIDVTAAESSPDVRIKGSPTAAVDVVAETASAVADSKQDGAKGDDTDSETTAENSADALDAAGTGRAPSSLGRVWLAGIAAALVLLAGGIGTGGYLALRYHHQSQAIARNNTEALKAAIDCVSATQAPDTNAMIASERKIVECGTGAFREQAMLYTATLVQAYQSANVHVQVSDVRAAVERNNKDGSVDVLVAMRVKVDTDQSQNETGYRLRVTMASDEGTYRIAKLDQVTM